MTHVLSPPGSPTQPLVASQVSDGGALVRLTLSSGKGNVITAALSRELQRAIVEAVAGPRLRAIVLTGEGKHFSFGASVEEHLPEEAAAMLGSFHSLIGRMLACPVPLVAAVRGQCLGGGLELALACTRIIAAPHASLGQPEIRLAVFAPAASVLLPPRVGQATADELLLTGRSLSAYEALRVRLVDDIADDPAERAEAWAREHLFSLSPAALRRALAASRRRFVDEQCRRLAELEALYLAEVVPAADAREGLLAFLEKRPPRFTDA
jgi:cyclohexa-1,5-dienecarbonyl-CoA hydratase